MRNLTLLYNKNKQFDCHNVKSLIIDPDLNNLSYICTNNKIVAINFEENELKDICDVFDVVSFEYLVLSKELCIATAIGEVIIYNLQTKAETIVSYNEGGILAMSWGPDQEIVAFVTKDMNVIMMNSYYDVLETTALDDSSFGDQEFITVGWGKKETQFHGSEGKAAATKKYEFEAQTNLANIDNKISISWRGDGEYFAVSFVGKFGRMFKVFNKDGILQFTSEKCVDLEAAFAWKPTGLWIAVPQAYPNKYVITLFEKNGLKHREIVLPFMKDNEIIKNLVWSSDSDILAIETFNNKTRKSCIYLYTICNYHWYLKQFLEFESNIKAIQWDLKHSQGKSLHIFQEGGLYSIYRWDFNVIHSTGNLIENESIVAVIDGINLLVTNFRGTIIPPPMCGYTLKAINPINFTGFLKHPSEDQNMNMFFTINSENTVTTYNCDFITDETTVKRLKSVKTIDVFKFNNDNHKMNVPLFNHHWIWLTENKILFCNSLNNLSQIFLYEMESSKMQELSVLNIPGHIGSITNIDSTSLVVYFVSGLVYKISIENDKILPQTKLFQLPEFCEKIEAVNIENKLKIFSLKNKQMLYMNDEKLAPDVTSFFITEKFLVFTILDHLKFYRFETNTISERRIERGGKLILIIPKDSRTVLQMPRGNLEVIQPRVLSLCIVGDFLDNFQYKKAFDLLRKQRINLNLLIDHNMEKFLNEIEVFLDEIKNPQWLNLFLTELQDDDVTVTMYSSNYETIIKDNQIKKKIIANKINMICNKMCEVMKKKDSNNLMLPIITSYVKRKDLEKALDVIWTVKKMETLMIGDTQTNTVKSEEALKYLICLVDVNDLYNVALGMYDFNLVMFVASKSQKDPKEYVPFLNGIKQIEDKNYQKYVIDLYLKRYEKALEHIVHCEQKDYFDKCLELIQKHNLYPKALRLLPAGSWRYKEVAKEYGNYLRTTGVDHLWEASIMYERAGDLRQAILSAKHILDWKRCVFLMKKSDDNEKDISDFCCSLITPLIDAGRHSDASQIMRIYKNDFEKSIKTMLEGGLYIEVINLIHDGDDSLLQTLVSPCLEECGNKLIESLKDDTEQYDQYKQRLLFVRLKKKVWDGDDPDDLDQFSDTSSLGSSSRYSGSSRGSGKSTQSSRNRRKLERKLVSLKEGNPYEDIALIDALYNLIQKISNRQDEVCEICISLIQVNLDNLALLIQKSFQYLLLEIESSLDDIWIPEMTGQVMSGITDYLQIQKAQFYSLLKPHLRYKPKMNFSFRGFEILKEM